MSDVNNNEINEDIEKANKEDEEERVSIDEAINHDPSQMEDYFFTTIKDIEAFEQQSWEKGEGFKLPNFKAIETRLEGMDSGMYLLAAESNVGKSALMMNLLYDICTCSENKVFGVYYSLDDSKFEIIPRVIAMQQSIPISVVAKPQRFKNKIDNAEENSATYQEWLDKRKEGLENLKNNNNHFKIEDSTKIKTVEDLYKHIQNVIIYLSSIDPEIKLVVGIDSINDLRFGNKGFKSTADENAEKARTVKDWAVEFNIPILAPCHLRKINQNRRPTLDDLKESVEYVYEASVVWLLYNDVGKNKQGATIYYDDDEYEGKRPVIEVDWAKNKKSSFKGRTYCYFSPEYSKAIDCDNDTIDRYDALLFES